MMQTGALIVLARLPEERQGASFSLPSFVVTKTKRAGEQFAEAAELVAEVVSPDDPGRDYVTKRNDYADAGVPEYWIIDRAAQSVLVLRLEDGRYVEHGRFGPGQTATSFRLPGFAVRTDDLLAPGK